MQLFIQASAEQDILQQVEWYVQEAGTAIARRFYDATMESLDSLLAMPHMGAARPTTNARLVGLRMWPVKDFDVFHIYYLILDDTLTVVRLLHGKRNSAAILSSH